MNSSKLSLQKILLAVLFSFSSICINGQDQQTVGVSVYGDDTFDGYTFFSPMANNSAYLIDNCGFLVNKWERGNKPGLSGYLTDSGVMLRTNKVNNPQYSQASTGGNLELVDWDNNTIWASDFNKFEHIQHHDAKLLPNGNIIFIGWERMTTTEQIAAGRKPSDVSEPHLWGEFIWEIRPVGSSDYEIVWEWHLQDHFVQDHDQSKANFGSVANEIGRVNINYQGPSAWDDDDWWHCNAIDYNADLDQILLNSRNNNELWIIDHSTTTAEAATEAGGNSGQGGNLLFRWGNPEAYDRGSQNDLLMFGSHGHHWIPEGLPNAGKIMYFNNGDDRPEGYYSTVEMIAPQQNGFNYDRSNAARYFPLAPEVVYEAANPFDFRSFYLSNAQQLPNGNVFINEGGEGRLFEINADKEIVWQYISPVRQTGPVSQGSFIFNNDIFRAYKLGPDFAGFAGKDLSAGELLEGDSEFNLCQGVATEEVAEWSDVELYFDMNTSILSIDKTGAEDVSLTVTNISGQLVMSKTALDSGTNEFDLSASPSGILLVQLQRAGHVFTRKVFR